ncbi:MAG: hypothetical protein AMXMBFR34_18640 [Myxococcaceae bacterium]
MPRLARRFHVYALDVRGHGKSQHRPGRYSFTRCALDLIELLCEVVKRPALVTGNSSGGIIGMIAAARAPEWVRGLLMEDPPLFSTDWPRLRDDTWVHGFFVHTVKTLPDLATYLSTLQIPSKGKVKLMSFPRPLAWLLGGAIRRRRRSTPARRWTSAGSRCTCGSSCAGCRGTTWTSPGPASTGGWATWIRARSWRRCAARPR